MLYKIASLILVAFLWGCTNPVIKQNSKNIIKVKANSKIKQFLLELKFLALNIQYLIPMGLNQLGSVVYFLTLQDTPISLAVPVANSLTFVFTALSGYCLGEQLPTRNTIIGVVFILFGTSLCCYNSYLNDLQEGKVTKVDLVK